jgi:hypothetical protein
MAGYGCLHFEILGRDIFIKLSFMCRSRIEFK